MSGQDELDGLIREAVNVLSEGFAVLDSDFKMIFANRASLRHFGKFHAAVLDGADRVDVTKASVRPHMPGASEEAITAFAVDFMRRLESGEAVDMVTEAGQTARVVYRQMSNGKWGAISTDISDLMQKEKELKVAKRKAEAASDAKSSFLANVSHEIRTPLNGMLGMAQVLSASSLTADQREQVDAILDSGKTLVALLNDVLDLSKIEAGKMEITPVDTDLSHVLRRLYKLWQSAAEEKGVELTLDFAASLPARLKFDAVRVRQCIGNLMSNAVKFTEAGEVNVHVSIPRSGPNAGLVQVRVTDSGIGMDEATIGRLFAPFTQADGSTSRRFGGTGLGLSISRKLAQMMGGDVKAKSTPGEGSVFTLTFAAEAAAEAAPQGDVEKGSRSAPRLTRPLNVLVVDDVPLNRKVARLFMEHHGWSVVEAGHGGEALDCLAAATFDVVLLDVHMPVMDGPETLAKLRASGEAWAGVPVIALTANAMSGDRERYVEMGMDGYISKPIDQREMFAEIGRVMAAKLAKAA
ncbi:Sensor histidine kinase RcsC [Alphaproteobacteria bacterium SO-S41]|nr:Sensor histidine kinase RcsC [Alphaproteobacteria bacterium SO-S41]